MLERTQLERLARRMSWCQRQKYQKHGEQKSHVHVRRVRREPGGNQVLGARRAPRTGKRDEGGGSGKRGVRSGPLALVTDLSYAALTWFTYPARPTRPARPSRRPTRPARPAFTRRRHGLRKRAERLHLRAHPDGAAARDGSVLYGETQGRPGSTLHVHVQGAGGKSASRGGSYLVVPGVGDGLGGPRGHGQSGWRRDRAHRRWPGRHLLDVGRRVSWAWRRASSSRPSRRSTR